MSYGILRARGDYGVAIRRRRGDPGFFGTLGGLVSAIVPGAAPIVAGIQALTGGKKKAASPGAPVLPAPGLGGLIQRIVPGGSTGLIVGGARRGRRMNPANPKALNRAIRRVSSFSNLVQRSKKSVAAANRALNPGHRAAAPHRRH